MPAGSRDLIGAGSAAITFGLTAAEDGIFPVSDRGITVRSSALSLPEKTAPSTAVPSEPPIERNRVAPEVATPRSE